jgi:hypothetical protein
VGLLIWRWRRTYKDAARARPPFRGALYPLHGVTRAAQPLPEAQRARELPAELQDETPAELHLHFHGVSAEDVAAILRNQDQP